MKKILSTMMLSLAMGAGLSGCMSTGPTMGGSSGNTVSGGAAGGSASGQNSALENCTETLGTLSIFEDTHEDWWGYYRRHYPNLGSTIPVLRTMIQQSNCFVLVERGKAMSSMTKERELMNSGELRTNSNFGKGQLVAADYTMQPSIQFSEKGTGGLGGLVGGIGGFLLGGAKSNEAATTLLLVDNRSGVQVSSSVGNAQNWDFKAFGLGFFGALVGAGGYSDTPEGKVITAAFADSYNHMVKSLRNYKAQQVEGGLGKGGKLTVGG
ncbi:CsgG/HfaB family protein [Thalassotalea sediminis]|uniref:CsgG/HfaB family protein n=1 Tax=Thalassotalea sediminis TaxID=1759089 RepID=UPI0025737D43|nr:CsgG/HfaB family protein [Thalassotalea sediminis]